MLYAYTPTKRAGPEQDKDSPYQASYICIYYIYVWILPFINKAYYYYF